jgi:hypothetical protein
MTLNKIVATTSLLVACALFVVACTSQTSSLNPLGPTGVGSLALSDVPSTESCTDGQDNDGDKLIDCADPDCAGNAACGEGSKEVCTDGQDNDGDKLIDCADSDCSEDPSCKTPPPPPGIPCSPGYWKNHTSDFNEWCDEAAAIAGDPFTSCAQIWTAITCNGGPKNDCTGARRQAAATALNTVSGCTE